MTNTNPVYGQLNQTISNITDSVNIQNIAAKKVHVGDIDIAYKTFGKGDPILLVSGTSSDMNAWEPSTLRDLSSNHTVIVPTANSLIIAGKIPGAWLIQIKDAGHAVMGQYPDEINRVLQTFLSTTTSPN